MSKERAARIRGLGITILVVSVVAAVVTGMIPDNEFLDFFAAATAVVCGFIGMITLVVGVAEDRS